MQANLLSKNNIANFVKRHLNKNKLNQLPKKVKAISTKGLAKNLKNRFSILNGAKNFSSGIFQNYLVFMSAKTYFQYFIGTTRTDS